MLTYSPSLLGKNTPSQKLPEANINPLLSRVPVNSAAIFTGVSSNYTSLQEQNLTVGSPFITQSTAANTTWINVQSYTNIVLTMLAVKNNYYSLIWAGGDDEPQDVNSAICIDQFRCTGETGSITKSYPIKSKWVSILFSLCTTQGIQATVGNPIANLSYILKQRSTEVKIGTDLLPASIDIDASFNSLYTILTDNGRSLLTSNDVKTSGAALYTYLADKEGKALTLDGNQGNHYLAVGLRDASGYTLSSTHTPANSLCIVPADTNGQAAFDCSADLSLNGISVNGVALIYSLQDDTGYKIGSTKSQHDNALYVQLFNNENDPNYSIHIKTRVNDTTVKYITDTSLNSEIQEIITSDFISRETPSVMLRSLNLFNNNSIDVWVRIYDVYASAANSISDLSQYLKFNMAIKKNSERDFAFELPVKFNFGMYVLVEPLHYYDTLPLYVKDVYLSATYSKTLETTTQIFEKRATPISNSPTVSIAEFDLDNIKGWVKMSIDGTKAYAITECKSTTISGNTDFSFNTSDARNYNTTTSGRSDFVAYPRIPNINAINGNSSSNVTFHKIFKTDVSFYSVSNSASEHFTIWSSFVENTKAGKGGAFTMGQNKGLISSEIENNTNLFSVTLPDASISQIDYYNFTGQPSLAIYNIESSLNYTDQTYYTNSINYDGAVVIRGDKFSIVDICLNTLNNSNLPLTYNSDVSVYFGDVCGTSINTDKEVVLNDDESSLKYFSSYYTRGSILTTSANYVTCSFCNLNKGQVTAVTVINGTNSQQLIPPSFSASLGFDPSFISIDISVGGLSKTYRNTSQNYIKSFPGQPQLVNLINVV